jgi:uracil-DNA glycosylase family 4
VSAEKLASLHTEMGACRQCLEAGYDIFPRAIFSGPISAQLMTIGQAPGITEKEAGRPFNAGSGTRLFAWLAQAGIDEAWFRSTQYMTSVTKCFPGKAASGGGDRVPSRAEQALCRPFLEREIALVNPQVIIPIGRLAIELFYPARKKLTEIIGTQIEHQGCKIIPLPHPSGASRWPMIPENQKLIARAVSLIKAQFEDLFPG